MSDSYSQQQDINIANAIAKAAKKQAAKDIRDSAKEQDVHIANALAEAAKKHTAKQRRSNSWLSSSSKRRNSNAQKSGTPAAAAAAAEDCYLSSSGGSSIRKTTRNNNNKKMSTTMAQRKHGVCQGCLYRSQMNIADGTTTSPTYEYCVLVGVQFSCYESHSCWEKGQPPVASFCIVGSSMNFSSSSSSSGSGRKSSASSDNSFKLVTNQGTHLTCQAPTTACRDIWLHALSAGLEGSLLSFTTNTSSSTNAGTTTTTFSAPNRPVLSKVKPRHAVNNKTQKYCASCGKMERWEFPLMTSCRPITQHGYESRQDLCYKCETAQGVLDHCYYIEDLYLSAEQERTILLQARAFIIGELHPDYPLSEKEPCSISVTQLSHHILKRCLASTQYDTFCRTSPVLEDLKLQFSQGLIGVLEFIEQLENSVGICDKQFGMLKTQAFRAAGDMGTALKLLHETCHNENHDMELLQSILEFFLDLLQQDSTGEGYGELKTLAFFWPQICTIHLQLLPPTNSRGLKQVEMLEDFLLTVATQYSVHLAIELIWCHVADLEDSRSLPYCLKRKYAVLRFLCELESLLFDFDSGWGGGSVTVGQFLSPSNHQMACLKSTMKSIQSYRMLSHHSHLSRSRRLSKIRKSQHATMTNQSDSSNDKEREGKAVVEEDDPEQMAKEALRIARNADYLSSHLAFTKRLCDIAEKLRFEDVDKRPVLLRKELSKLNSSGAMGGDPLNTVKAPSDTGCGDSALTRVIRIPMNEGHVFRSKERTPVLLLVEVNDEGAENDPNSSKNTITAFPKHLPAADEDDEERGEKEKEANIEETISHGNGNGEIDENDANEENGNKKAEVVSVSKEDEEKKEACGKEEEEKNSNNIKLDDKEESVDVKNEAATTSDDTMVPQGDSPSLENGDDNNHDKSISTAAGSPKANGGDANDVGSGGGAPVAEPPVNGGNDCPSTDDASVVKTPVRKNSDGPDNERRKVTLSGSLEGLDDENKAPRVSHHALRRFDSPKKEPRVITPSTNKETVEELVSEVVAKQLHIPMLKGRDERDLHLPTLEKEASEGEGIKPKLAEGEQEISSGEAKETQSIDPVKTSKVALVGRTSGVETNNSLSKTGDTRREVLTAIMRQGMSGGHAIAEGAATATQRHLQDLERRRAVELLLTGEDLNAEADNDGKPKSDRQELLSLGIRSASKDDLEGDLTAAASEDDEAMEAIRLVLIQYQVAQGGLSLNDAAAVLAPREKLKEINKRKSREGTMIHFGKEFPEIQAGDIDDRLVGCGVLPPAVLQALTLWKANMITNGELLELVKKDLQFVKISSEVESSVSMLNENSAFWGRFAFGERWAEKRSRIAATSPEAAQPGWDLIGIIVKSNDDLRQEAFVMQLIELCKEAFEEAGLELWLLPYRILSTGRTTGIIEMVRNAMSIDALKKRPGYGSGGLREHLLRMTQFAADPSEAYKTAQRNFVRSLAAYSLLSYLFLFKDRHNGNLLLDTAGHVIHIDFGFVFGVAPGGSFSLEISTPFKLTEEMIEVMDGLRSSHFSEFVTLFCCGFLALQAHCDTFLTLVEITCQGSTFKCFEGRNSADVVEEMKQRLQPDLDKEQSIAFCLDIIKDSTQSYGTAQYDYFQYLSQGIST